MLGTGIVVVLLLHCARHYSEIVGVRYNVAYSTGSAKLDLPVCTPFRVSIRARIALLSPLPLSHSHRLLL